MLWRQSKSAWGVCLHVWWRWRGAGDREWHYCHRWLSMCVLLLHVGSGTCKRCLCPGPRKDCPQWLYLCARTTWKLTSRWVGGGAGRGEACGADIFPSQMLCSLTRGSDFILSSFLLHIFWSLSMLSNLAISTGKRCDAPHMLLLWLSGLQSWLSSPNNGMFRGFLPTYITHTQSKWLLLFEAPLTSLFRWCT